MFHSLYHKNAGNADTAISAGVLPPFAKDKSADALCLSWPASYLDGMASINPDQWRLGISGLVDKPQTFSLKDFTGFTRIQQNRRLVLADGLTFRANWEGFVVQELLHRVSPQPEAQFLIQTNAAGQQECISLKELLSNRALFCLRANGLSLPALYGGPLRLLVFHCYAHKGLGQITHLELSRDPIPGFFAQKGYDSAGTILPGEYYASDLQQMQTIQSGEEITQW